MPSGPGHADQGAEIGQQPSQPARRRQAAVNEQPVQPDGVPGAQGDPAADPSHTRTAPGVVANGTRARAATVMPPIQTERPGAHRTRPHPWPRWRRRPASAEWKGMPCPNPYSLVRHTPKRLQETICQPLAHRLNKTHAARVRSPIFLRPQADPRLSGAHRAERGRDCVPFCTCPSRPSRSISPCWKRPGWWWRRSGGQFVYYRQVQENLVNALNGFVQEVCPVSRPLKRESAALAKAKRPGEAARK